MDIRRMTVEENIDFAICNRISKENRRLIVPDLYDTLMGVVIRALNSDSGKEIPELVYDEFKEMNQTHAVWDMVGEYTIELTSMIRMHFLREGHDKQFKYKFIKSAMQGVLATDSVLVDLELTLHWGKVKQNNTEDGDILEVIESSPDLETVNDFYERQEKELRNNRKYPNRY